MTIQNKLKELENQLSIMETMIFTNLVSWNDVIQWKVGENRNISETINKKIYQAHNIMIFETIVPPNATFPQHWHNFYEHNYVISGFYTDGKTQISTGDWIQYEELVKHTIKNNSDIEDLKLIVIFTKK